MSAVRLVPLARERLPELAPVFHDPDVLRFTRAPNPPPPGFTESWYAAYERGRADGTCEAFAMVEDGGSLVGLAVAPHRPGHARG